MKNYCFKKLSILMRMNNNNKKIISAEKCTSHNE